MFEMRCTYTNFLIVTCYSLLAVIFACCAFALPLLCLRSAFAVPSFCLRSWDYRMNGPTTDLQRTCNGPALEGVGSSRRISLKPVLILGNGFGMVFTFFWRIMCILWLLLKTTELLLPELFSRFQAYWTRWISQKLMLIVMQLRLSAAYILSSDLYITASLSLAYNNISLFNRQVKISASNR